jgi:hypothetical protein
VTKPWFTRAIATSVFLAALVVPVVASAPARARTTAQTQTPVQSQTPTPSVSATPIQVNARNSAIGLLILTACAAGGYFTAKLIRRRKRPRPPGPWFGGRR